MIYQFINHLIFNGIFGLLNRETISNLLQGGHFNASALRNILQKYIPNSTNIPMNLLTVGITHFVKKERLYSTLEFAVSDDFRLYSKLFKGAFKEHHLGR